MFTAYRPGITNPLTLDSLFVKPAVVKVAKNSETVGIVTRSDILRAVMLHFDLDVWQ